MFFDASQGSLMANICTISRPLAKITMRGCLAMRGALRAPLIVRERLMVIFARGREIVPIFAMSDPWLALKNTEHPPKIILVNKIKKLIKISIFSKKSKKKLGKTPAGLCW